ncbi:SusC/RagA family TonB-linked outer membrane protein [Sphingobacterium litopenaei]|uniref:SusC/RagA family TonB-linked outer membrane protein n=1 Tax=Sphingobacterium litopenaei TaxID=2763500 RepID=A0ABR7YCE9_9SPHI|nr:SusC/RagA family TonB-linked outer membrane protein [Sphingobacterium litopenaei]MBD1428878.1 SusC/RagA family TonB-linked outer membrane protein [Sphingobacterium litopenaei]
MKHKCLKKRLAKSKSELLSLKMTTLMTAGMITIASAHTFAQRIQLNVKNQNLRTVLAQLEKQSGYSFIYDSKLCTSQIFNLNLDESSVETSLVKLSKELGFEYSIVNKTVTLKTIQQTVELSGKVSLLDEDGVTRPATGVSVTIKGTSKSVMTNNAGEYKLNAPLNSQIVFSLIGYKKKEVNTNDLAVNRNVVLELSNEYIDEVVVMAYGRKETKENQTGSAFTITAKDIENRPALRIDALLEGLVPGVEFQSQDGGSNASARPRFSTRVRGESSTLGGTTSNEPLWIVDGVPLYTGGTTNSIPGTDVSVSPLTYLDVNDIESLTVLKDASATTIYGANGSNGVILVTTKKGKGKPKISYSLRAGLNKRVGNNFTYLDGPQYLSIVKRMGMLDGLGNIDTTVNTYWPDHYFRNGFNTMHSLSISGSTDNISYYLSGNVYDDKLITIGNTTKRYSMNSNLRANVSKRMTVFGGINGSYNLNDLFNPGNAYYQYSPLISPYGTKGEYIERDPNGRLLQNMPGLAEQNDHNQNAIWILGNAGFNYSIIDGLNFNTNNGFDISSINENQYESMNNYTGRSSNGYASRAQNQVVNLVSSNTLNYMRDIFSGKFDIMVGTEARRENRHSVSAGGWNFPNDNIREISFVSSTNRTGIGSRAKQTLLSYFGRAGYNFDDRYNVNYTYRKDGSSNFGKDVKWGTFSSIGAAWTVSNESFWPENDVMNFLKFKVSYGTTGNSRFSSNYAKGVYSYADDNAYGGNAGAVMSRGMNDKLKWETTNMLNTGIDFDIFRRVNIAAEYYRNITHDLIDDSYVSMVGGFRRIYQNVGKLQNSGFELTVNSYNIQKENFKWNTTWILSLNRNKVLELSEGLDRSTGNTIMREGYNSRSHYLVRWAGVDPSTGDPMWYDINGNITKVYNTANRVIVGNPTPDFYGGITNNFSYKNFGLSVFLKYNKGGYYFDQISRNIGQDGLNILDGNQGVDVLNAWQYPGYLATFPRLSNVSTSSIMNSTRYLKDRTYLALENISFSYRLDDNLVKKLHLSNLTLTAMGSKLGMWTPYSNKKGTAKNFVNGSNANIINDNSIVMNTYDMVLESNVRTANYSFAISVMF